MMCNECINPIVRYDVRKGYNAQCQYCGSYSKYWSKDRRVAIQMYMTELANKRLIHPEIKTRVRYT